MGRISQDYLGKFLEAMSAARLRENRVRIRSHFSQTLVSKHYGLVDDEGKIESSCTPKERDI